jgi:hypothetical protein
MWKLTNREDNAWGIEGYEAPKKYTDAKRQILDRKVYEDNLKVWSKKGHYEKKVLQDKDGNPIIPKRPNYLDEVVKLAKSFYDEKRAQEILEKKTPEEPKKDEKSKDKKQCKMYKNERMLYTDWLILFEKNKIKPRLEEIKDLDKIMDKVNAKKLSDVEKAKEKYGTKKGSLPKADRISLVHDSEYVGERIPFYNTPAEDGDDGAPDEEGGKKKKKQKKLAFPSKTAIWPRAPSWGYKKSLPKNQDVVDRRKDEDEKKLENVMKKFEDNKVDLKGDMIKSFNTMDHWKQLNFKYYPPSKKSEAWDKWKEENPPKNVGPQQYFKTPLQTFEKKKKKAADGEEPAGGDDEKKDFYVDRRKMDKRIYKPMKGHIF